MRTKENYLDFVLCIYVVVIILNSISSLRIFLYLLKIDIRRQIDLR